jgi:hypothetical protein
MMLNYAGYTFEEDSEILDTLVGLHEQFAAAGLTDIEIAAACCAYLRHVAQPDSITVHS